MSVPLNICAVLAAGLFTASAGLSAVQAQPAKPGAQAVGYLKGVAAAKGHPVPRPFANARYPGAQAVGYAKGFAAAKGYRPAPAPRIVYAPPRAYSPQYVPPRPVHPGARAIGYARGYADASRAAQPPAAYPAPPAYAAPVYAPAYGAPAYGYAPYAAAPQPYAYTDKPFKAAAADALRQVVQAEIYQAYYD